MSSSNQEFRILSCLGRGGFGEVYLAQKIAEGGFRKDVALKMLNPSMARVDDVANRLKDEARILALLNHRAIVKVDLLARIEGRWTVVMEYVEGGDLNEVLSRCSTLPLGAVLEIGAEVAGALDYAYNHEIADPNHPELGRQPLRLLHRDIKPHNIQVTPHGDVKVLDFGIAKAQFESREAVTGTNVFMTPEYAAPERLRGIEHPGGDIFSLGAVLYELLCGKKLDLITPYLNAMLGGQTLDLASYQARRLTELKVSLSKVRGMNEAVQSTLLATLSWTPEQRPSARQLSRALRGYASALNEDEVFPEWCERVVGPIVAKRRIPSRNLFAEATLAQFAGRTVTADGGASFGAQPKAEVTDHTPPPQSSPDSGQTLLPTELHFVPPTLSTETPPVPRLPQPNRVPQPEVPAEGPDTPSARHTSSGPMVVFGVGLGAMILLLAWLQDEKLDSQRLEPDLAAPKSALSAPTAPTPAEPIDPDPVDGDVSKNKASPVVAPAAPPKAAPTPKGENTLTASSRKKTAPPATPPAPTPEKDTVPTEPAPGFVQWRGKAISLTLVPRPPLSGDPVTLRQEGKNLAPGYYTVRAVFSEAESASDAGIIRVDSNKSHVLNCVPLARNCSLLP